MITEATNLNSETKLDACYVEIEVFNYRTNWDSLIRPHLHDPVVEHALVDGMNEYRAMWACRGPSMYNWDEPYCVICGPLQNEMTDYWHERCDQLLDEAIERGEVKFEWPKDEEGQEVMNEAIEQYSKLAGEFYPKPDTLEWYVPHDVWGYHLASWQRELGKKVFPDLDWKIMQGYIYSLAYGTDKIGNIKVIFDIQSFEAGLNPAQLLEQAIEKSPYRRQLPLIAADTKIREEQATLCE